LRRSRTLPIALLGLAALAVLGALVMRAELRRGVRYAWARVSGGASVAQRVAQFGAGVDERVRTAFGAAGSAYPPRELALLAFKDARTLELYAREPGSAWMLIKRYPVLAASGVLGPKLAEGDRQVPEGVYRVQSLNPNSRFHLSLRLDYPSDFDRRMARRDGRTQLGGDIMIHGNSVSVGCLAIGDEAAEELFVLAARIDFEHEAPLRVLICPTDFRRASASALPRTPSWLPELYESLRAELRAFPCS